MTHDTTHDSTINMQGLPQPPTLDPADYREGLAELELSPDQEREVLEYLWHIVKSLVDAGLGLDAASTVLGAFSRAVFDPHSPDVGATLSERKAL